MKFINKVKKIIDKDKYKINSVKQLNNKASKNFTNKNISRLNFVKDYLMNLSNVETNENLLDINKYLKYFDYVDNKLQVNDINNSYLTSKEVEKMYKNFAKVRYLEHKNKDKISLFVTFTNPSEYHYYMIDKERNEEESELEKSMIKNPKCKFKTLGETIVKSLDNQRLINRTFYNELKKYLKRRKINSDFDYVKVLERHKNKTFHSHSIFYIEEEQLEVFEEVFQLIVNRFNLYKVDMQQLEDSKSSTYVMKYLLKDLVDFDKSEKENKEDSNNKDCVEMKVRHYYSNFRFFNCSNISKEIPQKVIDKVYMYLKINHNEKFMEMYNNKEIPILKSIIDYIKDNNIIWDCEEVDRLALDWELLKETIDEYFIENYNNGCSTLEQCELYLNNYLKDNEEVLRLFLKSKDIKLKNITKIYFKDNQNEVIYKKVEYQFNKFI